MMSSWANSEYYYSDGDLNHMFFYAIVILGAILIILLCLLLFWALKVLYPDTESLTSMLMPYAELVFKCTVIFLFNFIKTPLMPKHLLLPCVHFMACGLLVGCLGLLMFLAMNIHLVLCFEINRLISVHPLTSGGYIDLSSFLGSFINLGLVHWEALPVPNERTGILTTLSASLGLVDFACPLRSGSFLLFHPGKTYSQTIVFYIEVDMELVREGYMESLEPVHFMGGGYVSDSLVVTGFNVFYDLLIPMFCWLFFFYLLCYNIDSRVLAVVVFFSYCLGYLPIPPYLVYSLLKWFFW